MNVLLSRNDHKVYFYRTAASVRSAKSDSSEDDDATVKFVPEMVHRKEPEFDDDADEATSIL